jgi:hypothetical protein
MPHPFTSIGQVTIEGSLHGQQTVNVLHFGANGAEPNWNQLITDILDCITTALRPATSSDWTLTKLTHRVIHPQLGDPVDHFPAVATAGTGLPAEVSFAAQIVRINTGLGGRRHRGRMFLAGVVANDVQQSKLSDAALARLVAFAACMAGKFIKADGAVDNPAFEIGVLSRTQAKDAGQTLETAFTPATALNAQRVVGCMRSRRIGHGR